MKYKCPACKEVIELPDIDHTVTERETYCDIYDVAVVLKEIEE